VANSRRETVVVGLGIVGAACAWTLARRGHRVLALEAGEGGAETSCRAMGHIGIYDDSDAQLALSVFARRTWDEAARALPPEAAYVRRGSLWVAHTASELETGARRLDRLRSRGIEAELLDAAELYRHEPNLAEGLSGAVRVPGDAVIDTAPTTRYLAEEAQRSGAELRRGARVVRLNGAGVELASGERIDAEDVVLAAGWRSPELLPGLPVRPRKGHILLTAPRPGWVHHNVGEIGYMAETRPTQGDSISLVVQPRPDGRFLLGATRQYAGPSTDVDPTVAAELHRRIVAFVPGFSDLPIERSWAGLRPAGPDSVPIIGRWPKEPHLVLATGHEGIGITTSLATGRLVAELIEGAPPSIPLDPFSPARLFP
jgi:D-hydroxyproline dehydrogenase subunit beta